jgi:hypothetical protein
VRYEKKHKRERVLINAHKKSPYVGAFLTHIENARILRTD